MNVQDIMKMMKEFEKERMKQEINGEAITDAMDMGETNEEANDVYEAILGEIGMNMDDPSAVGTKKLGGQVKVQEEEKKDEALDDLESRLAALG